VSAHKQSAHLSAALHRPMERHVERFIAIGSTRDEPSQFTKETTPGGLHLPTQRFQFLNVRLLGA
jgi:hypothetical protein